MSSYAKESVELNPVSAGIVKEAVDYPWSSARYHLGLSATDALVKNKSLFGLVDDWAEYLRAVDEPETHTMLLRAIRTRRPGVSE